MISLEEIKKLSLLARIDLTPKEEKELQRDLGVILNYVSKLKEAPLKKIEVSEILTNVFRDDEPIEDKSEVKKGEHIKVKHIL